MQFKVPQDVQREDRIVGPLTLKQLIICGIGGTLAYAIYVALGKDHELIIWLPPVVIVGAITVAFAFVRPLDLSFFHWILAWLEFTFNPRRRYWIQSSGEVVPQLIIKTKVQSKVEKKAEAKAAEIIDKHKKIEELTKMVNRT